MNRVSSTLLVTHEITTVLSAKSDSDVMFCLQSYQGLTIDRSLVYQSQDLYTND